MLKELQSHPFGKPILVFGLGLMAVLLFIVWGRQKRNQGLADLETLQRRIQFSKSGTVTPSAAVLESLKQSIERLNGKNKDLDAQLFPGPDVRKTHPAASNSTAAYFELAGFVENAGQKFKAGGIGLPEKNRFGFSQFEQQGPGAEILPAVMAQKAGADMLLQYLLQAKPVALTAFKREFIQEEPESRTVLQQAAGTRSVNRIRHADTIEAGSKRDGFESYSFEVEFEGYTESLRRFLKALLSASLPVVVTGMEVRPLDRFGQEEGKTAPAVSNNPFDVLAAPEDPAIKDGPVPIIRNNLSAFKLGLEVFYGPEAGPGA